MTVWQLPTQAATSRFGEALGTRLAPGHVIALIGDLGAGKTTLAKAIARGMGVKSHVSSPTFGLVHEYSGKVPLFHFDPYRLTSSQELQDLGFHEYFERGGVVLIEWADKFPDLLPVHRITLRLILDDSTVEDALSEDSSRSVEAEAMGLDYVAVLSELVSDKNLQDLVMNTNSAPPVGLRRNGFAT